MNIFEHKQFDDEDFLFFKEKIFLLCGIHLNDSKKTLVHSRLNSRLDQLNMTSFSEYRAHLETMKDNDPEMQHFINLLTTNKTEWFREIEHFNFLVDRFLPAWKGLGKKTINIWSAASSTGEEVYTLALVMHKALMGSGIDYKIIGSDIDTKVLAIAQNGVYKKDQLGGIPEEYRRYFDMGTGEIQEWMKVKNEIRSHIKFEQFNLKNSDYKNLGLNFDLIFCRNVMIYFTSEMLTDMSQRFYDVATPEGILVISHSESLQNLKIPWVMRKPSIYTRGKLF